jgi:hypothetical protein
MGNSLFGKIGDLKMIRGRYGLIVVGILVAMLSVAAGAGYFMVFVPLPDPAVATRPELVRWLVLRDLSKESPEIREKILGRLDTEFEKIGDLAPSIEKLEESHRQMLWHNVGVLLPPWLMGKAEQYSHLASSKKVDYLDRFLDRAEEWNKVATACQKKNTGKAAGGSSVTRLIQDQMQSSENVSPQQRELSEFLSAVQARWLWRQLPSFNIFGRPAKSSKTN